MEDSEAIFTLEQHSNQDIHKASYQILTQSQSSLERFSILRQGLGGGPILILEEIHWKPS